MFQRLLPLLFGDPHTCFFLDRHNNLFSYCDHDSLTLGYQLRNSVQPWNIADFAVSLSAAQQRYRYHDARQLAQARCQQTTFSFSFIVRVCLAATLVNGELEPHLADSFTLRLRRPAFQLKSSQISCSPDADRYREQYFAAKLSFSVQAGVQVGGSTAQLAWWGSPRVLKLDLPTRKLVRQLSSCPRMTAISTACASSAPSNSDRIADAADIHTVNVRLLGLRITTLSPPMRRMIRTAPAFSSKAHARGRRNYRAYPSRLPDLG